jgi:DNA-binding CsgD family transcriptional regulator
MRQALDQLQGLGARPAARIVARRLRERGVRGLPRGPRPRTCQNPAGLTARELEVLVLLADGLRNAQIAQRLVVSEKTVDHHVSAVLRKLNVRSGGEASTEALRLGLLRQGGQPPVKHEYHVALPGSDFVYPYARPSRPAYVSTSPEPIRDSRPD